MIQQTTSSATTNQATQKQNVAMTNQEVQQNKYTNNDQVANSQTANNVVKSNSTSVKNNAISDKSNASLNKINNANSQSNTSLQSNTSSISSQSNSSTSSTRINDDSKPAVHPVSSVTANNTMQDVYNGTYQGEKQQYQKNQQSPVKSSQAIADDQTTTSKQMPAIPQSRMAMNFAVTNTQNTIAYASCNDLNQVVVDVKQPLSGDLKNQVQFSNGDGVKDVSQNGTQLTITTNNDICFQKAMTVTIGGQQYTIDPTNGTQMAVVRSQAFDNKYIYNGNDLGATYTPTGTTFKIYAPTASAISLNLFENDTDPNAKLKSWTPMTFDPNTGVWSVTIKGDLKDTAYDYNEEFANGKAYEVYDPYATACVEGGFRSVVLSPEEMGPAVTAGKVVDQNDPTNEVIGEIHVRDFTNDPSSGVSANLRGTYLGAVQPNTTDSKGNPTGLNYLQHQGINTVQIQPMYQYDDDGNNTNKTYQYDWGYDPENYNVPEGWYSTNRDDPATRIKECKEMVQGFHNAGIRVNMDVVYNHVADHGTNALAKSVPGYYFRYGNDGNLTNASACGNDVASERPMVRNYILHSVKYWHDEYGIDGFRFDLMGNLDVTTMNDIRKELPNVVMYGEGWNMGASIPDNQKADQANENQMPTIGSFNGWGRTVLRGDDNGKPYGYVTGNQSQQTMSQLGNFIYGCQNLKNTPSDAVDGGVNYVNPTQVINYAECHDNKTLFDVMKAAYPDESDDVLMRRAELANAITILNEGVPYVQVGQGFGRSKNGDGNSYRSGDAVNNIHWDTQDNRTWATAYEKALIQLRNSDPAFRMTTYSDMNNNMKWVEVGSNNGVIGYELTSPSTGKKYIIGYSNNASSQDLTGIPNGNWKVLIKNCNGYLANPQTINVTNGKTDIPSLSCLVLEQDPQTDNELQVTYQDANGNKVGDYSEGGSKPLGDTNSAAQQHVPSGYHFVKIVSSKNSSNVANDVQHNTTTVVVEVAKDQPATGSTTTNKPTNSSSSNQPVSGSTSANKPSNSSSNSQPASGSTTTNKPTNSSSSNQPTTGSTTTNKPTNSSSNSQPASGSTTTNKPTNSSSSSQPVSGSTTTDKPASGSSSNQPTAGSTTTDKPASSSSSSQPASGSTTTNKPTNSSSNSQPTVGSTTTNKPSSGSSSSQPTAGSTTTNKPSNGSSNSQPASGSTTTDKSTSGSSNSQPTTGSTTTDNQLTDVDHEKEEIGNGPETPDNFVPVSSANSSAGKTGNDTSNGSTASADNSVPVSSANSSAGKTGNDVSNGSTASADNSVPVSSANNAAGKTGNDVSNGSTASADNSVPVSSAKAGNNGGTTATTDHVSPSEATEGRDKLADQPTNVKSVADKSANTMDSTTLKPLTASQSAVSQPTAVSSVDQAAQETGSGEANLDHIKPLVANSSTGVDSSASSVSASSSAKGATLAQTGETDDPLALSAGIATLFAAGTLIKKRKN